MKMTLRQDFTFLIAFLIILASPQIVQGFLQISDVILEQEPRNGLTSKPLNVVRSIQTEYGGETCTNWKTKNCRLKPTISYANKSSSLYFWYPTVPGSCNHKCGDSKKLKGISCFDRNLTAVDISNCLHLGIPETSQTCSNFACMTYKIHTLPWNECNESCGWGYQTRKEVCIDSLGNLVKPSYCETVGGLIEIRNCFVQACNVSYWDASSWSACPKTCGGSKRVRNVTCIQKGKIVDHCLKPQLKQEELCNSQPCKDYSWLVGTWTSGSPYRERIVQCVDGAGMEVDDSHCLSKKPLNHSSFPRANNSKAYCGNGCSKNGICQDDACICFDGWEGLNCERLKNCSGFLGYSSNKTVDCCKLVDFKQTCCKNSTAKLDKDGNCCESGILDACGICNGDAIAVDSHNKCCSSIRDEKGVCCESGNVDECHVCDGNDSTCATAITLSLSANVNSSSLLSKDNMLTSLLIQKAVAYISSHIHASQDSMSVVSIHVDNGTSKVARNQSNLFAEKGYLQNMNVTVGILLNSPLINMTSTMIKQHLRPGMLNIMGSSNSMEVVEANVSSIKEVTRTGVCGNGICEIGERCTWDGKSATTDSPSCCQDDCPYVASSCRTKSANRQIVCSGHGICFDTTGECSCFVGHGGPDCSECVEGWTSTADGFCIKLPDPFTLRQLHRIFTSSSFTRKGNPSYAYIGALILLVVFLVISIGVIVYIKFIKSSKNQHVSVVCNHEDNLQLESKRNWRTSILGPFEDFDVIPVTSAGYRRRSNDPAQEWEMPTTIYNNHRDGNGRRASATELLGEDLTEEEESKILQGRKSGILKHVRSFGKPLPMPYLIDYLSDSECESESSDEADLQNFIMMSYTQ